MKETTVIIVGAGPAGLATSACLKKVSIPNIILEREDCLASLWKRRSYDRLHLHLAKEFCSLPHMPHSSTSPTYIPKDLFVRYLENYASAFGISPEYNRSVGCASFHDGKWRVVARRVNGVLGKGEKINDDEEEEEDVYVAPFLVVATGDNSEPYIPALAGIERFEGEVLHSSDYKSGVKYQGKSVLVVGGGNSGMEIAYDLSNHGSHASIVVRSPVHIFSREMIRAGMILLKYVPLYMVDAVISWYAKLKHGDLSKYGLRAPAHGPFYLKSLTGRSPVIDVGTVSKIKAGVIQVQPGISAIREHSVVFENGQEQTFDAVVFATGYTNSVRKWLHHYDDELPYNNVDENANGNNTIKGKKIYPAARWKSEHIKGLYMAGFTKKGLMGIKMDAEAIAADIAMHGIH
ncbi:hypothetical protein DM860_015294 [Cuscuta australis]|uniref:Flavin-containing monooxygenase n=1 Tax=Cuscuta australis TaxID=267555 RepID=A0A328DPX9_9ASTE|nr:hypothetical protein DM860_015294 [Cuscuta australis]